MCTPRYRKVLTHDISPPLDVMMHLHLALYRGPIRKHADFFGIYGHVKPLKLLLT